ncbi:helix-turn-helix transcriptional regulator [Nonomuraea sp. NN258]|uniref:helix-turn-helix transcriptional regulator n=1 Tax=Nonomuraea antri TaxID=2730852 RepID=UPI00156A3E8A|nr:helix-turn-helix transcriptional regulator [Nonomuraea antri]NRQ31689.1 helix-turn-helix transcriptional regulator [Nonomuraea antri]
MRSNFSKDRSVTTTAELHRLIRRLVRGEHRAYRVVLADDPLGRLITGHLVRAADAPHHAAGVVQAQGEPADLRVPASRVRLLASAPVSMLLGAAEVAVVGVADAGAVVVTDELHLSSLDLLFDLLWTVAAPARQTHAAGLTHRGATILGLLAEGLTDAAIAARLNLGERTVRREVNTLMKLSRAASRFQLALCAQQLGWLPRPAGETNGSTSNKARIDARESEI